MTVWYPMPRRLASRLAQASALGCNRIVIALLRSAAFFGGRPRGGNLMPNVFSNAFRKTACSVGVMRRAFEKSKGGFSGSIFSLIPYPFNAVCAPCAHDSNARVMVTKGNDDAKNNSLHIAKRRLPDHLKTPLISVGQFSNIDIRITKNESRLPKANAMFRDVGNRLINIPFESFIYCIYNNIRHQEIFIHAVVRAIKAFIYSLQLGLAA